MRKKETISIYNELNEKKFIIITGDAKKKIKLLKDKSIKLMYGSPPYPNAKRNYKTWENDNYINEISPFIENAIPKLTDDGFIVINVKANRLRSTKDRSSERSLVIEELMLHMKKKLNLYCVDIEIWIKTNPVPTGVRVACQDAYEYNLWFSKSPIWEVNIDAIRTEYAPSSLHTYRNTIYKRRTNGLLYVSKDRQINPHSVGALPKNVDTDAPVNIVKGSVSNKSVSHQAVQPNYLPEKYMLACTNEGDIVLDPWVGSGTTGIVALAGNRRFIGIDISEEFAKLAEDNIQKSIIKDWLWDVKKNGKN